MVTEESALDPFHVQKFSDSVADIVRQRILSGQMVAGGRINEVALSDELRISRSPLREALRSLNGEGLITLLPGKGAFVVEFDRQGILELSELRLPLAVAIAGLAAERADQDDVAAFEPIVSEISAAIRDPALPYPFHIDFHELVARAAKSPRLAAAADEVERQLRLARLRSGNTPERARNALHEHLGLFETIVKRDPIAARKAMAEHISAGTASFLSLVESQQSKS
ncbi:MAG: hypothetical protein JWP75_328 [Frondihabitans sp.]|nr:hypothetical protein [Frondihabitans sp.]